MQFDRRVISVEEIGDQELSHGDPRGTLQRRLGRTNDYAREAIRRLQQLPRARLRFLEYPPP